MRVTIDLPDDLYQRALSIASGTGSTLSATVVDLIRRGLGWGAEDADVSSTPDR